MTTFSLFDLMNIVVRLDVDTSDFDDALAALQRLIGVETSDLAGVVFSGNQAWSNADSAGRWSILTDYIAQEAKLSAPEGDA